MTNTITPKDRLTKIGISSDVAEHLVSKNISSALQLAAMPTAELNEHLEGVDLGTDSIRKIKKRAKTLKALVDNYFVTIRGQVSPNYLALASTNANNNIINFHQGMESYSEMFGSLSFDNCPEFSSVLSPAAYLVDLARYIEEYIVPPNDDQLKLKTRRPDIWKIPLTSENTTQEQPFLQIVNDILSDKIENDETIDDAIETMATSVYPFNLPFNAALQKIRSYLEALEVELYEVYETFKLSPDAQNREYLKLSPEQVSFFTKDGSTPAELNQSYGYIEIDDDEIPHFTGVIDNNDLGGLNGVDIFMTQVGLTEKSALKSLLYQNIDTSLDKANDLLNQLFINQKVGNDQHLEIVHVPDDAPTWGQQNISSDASYYSTMQSAVVDGKLFTIVRTANGINTWLYNDSNNFWSLVSSGNPDFTDAGGWNKPEYYSTIQIQVLKNTLYLLARDSQGMETWVFDSNQYTWTSISSKIPGWSDAGGWNDVSNYATIQSIVVSDTMYLLARANAGICIYEFDPSTPTWNSLSTDNPPWSDTNKWNSPEYYTTIQTIALGSDLYLFGRANDGIHTWRFDTGAKTWTKLETGDPGLTDASGWSKPEYYSTIQAQVVNQTLFLVARGVAGIHTYEFDVSSNTWSELASSGPFTDSGGWNDTIYYPSIQTTTVGDKLYLLARGASDIDMYFFDTSSNTWVSPATNTPPPWSDAAGWNQDSQYSTIQTDVFDNQIFLLGNAGSELGTWSYDPGPTIWIMRDLIRDTIVNLNMETLDRLNRFIRLSSHLNWSYEDLDWALRSFAFDDMSSKAIPNLRDLQWIMDSLNLDLVKVSSLWFDVKTIGQGTGKVSQSLFDQVFNEPTLFEKELGHPYHPDNYALNPNYSDFSIGWNPWDDSMESNKKIGLRLMAALNMDADNLTALANLLFSSVKESSAQQVELTVPNLSLLYRYALLSNSLNLSIDELTILFDLLGIDEIPEKFTPTQVIELISWSQWMSSHNLTAYQLNYISKKITSKKIDKGYDLKEVPQLLKTLSESVTQWELKSSSLQFGQLMTKLVGEAFFNTLAEANKIDDRGIVLVNEFTFDDVSQFIYCSSLDYLQNDKVLSSGFTAGEAQKDVISCVFVEPNKDLAEVLHEGSVSFWVQTKKNEKNSVCLLNLSDEGSNFFTKLTLNKNGLLVTSSTGINTKVAYPNDGKWHFVVVSFLETCITVDGKKTDVSGLIIDSTLECSLKIGDVGDSANARVAEYRTFDKTASTTYIFDHSKSSGKLTGNKNYWPLNDGQGAQTIADLVGDMNGVPVGLPLWNIFYNIDDPAVAHFINEDGNLSQKYNPTNDESGSLKPLWKVVTKLQNILNKSITTQKNGTLEKLGNFYQTNKKLGAYADYTGREDGLSKCIQTLLTYRFSLSWSEFLIDLDRSDPFISDNLKGQFYSNKLQLDENAEIKRVVGSDGDFLNQWIISQSNAKVYFLNLRAKSLDIYKFIPEGVQTYNESYDFTQIGVDPDIIADLNEKPLSIRNETDQGSEHWVLTKSNGFVTISRYLYDDFEDNDVITKINTFISDLGHLLYCVNKLNLTTDQFNSLTTYPSRYFANWTKDSFVDFSMDQLKPIGLLVSLDNEYASDNESFEGYFSQADDQNSLLNYVAKMTEWDPIGLRMLSEWTCDFDEVNAIALSADQKTNVFSQKVAIDKEYAICGAPTSELASIYYIANKQWKEIAKIKNPHSNGNSSFGTAVAIEYDEKNDQLLLFISDPLGGTDGANAESESGVVYLYPYDIKKKNVGKPVAIQADGISQNDEFGSAVSIYEDLLCISAPKSGTSGKVFIYKKNDGTGAWEQQPTVIEPSTSDSLFGSSLSLYKKVLAVGSSDKGYLFSTTDGSSIMDSIEFESSNYNVLVGLSQNFAMLSGLSKSNGTDQTLIEYIDISDLTNISKPKQLDNSDFSGYCSLVIENETLIICDSKGVCYNYFIQNDSFVLKDSFEPVANASEPSVLALNSSNLIVGTFDIDSPQLTFLGFHHDIDWFEFAKNCFELANKLGVSIGFLLGFVKLAKVSLEIPQSDSDKDKNAKTFSTYQTYANQLENALKLNRSDDDWNSIYDPLQTKFLEAERDALAGYMLWYLRSDFTDIKCQDDLYELLLIDVGSSGCRTISPIKAALNSLQLYIERCRMHLEPEVTLEASADGDGDSLNAADVEWSWMSHYRIWEANREVFLYPENYCDPTLRKNPSSAYKDLINKLTQSNLTNDQAVQSFQIYFTDLEILTNLNIVSNCLALPANLINGTMVYQNKYFVFGKTMGSNGGYYYRTALAANTTDYATLWSQWSNWKKLGISVKADSLASVYANGRPFIFWTEVTKQQVSGTSSKFGDTKSFVYSIAIFYSFQNANGGWTNPKQTETLELKTGSSDAVTFDPPVIATYNRFLDIMTLSIGYNTKASSPDPASPLTLELDIIVNPHERFIWNLEKDGNSIRTEYSLDPEPDAADFVDNPSGEVFDGRKVLKLDSTAKPAYALPSAFDQWFNGDFTIGVWVYPTTLPSGDWAIMACPNSGIGDEVMHLVIRDKNPYMGFYGNDTRSSTIIKPNLWTFLVFRYDTKAQTQTIFVDGKLDTTGNNKPHLNAKKAPVIGDYSGSYAEGYMADVFVTDYPMRDQEIAGIYNEYQLKQTVPASTYEMNAFLTAIQSANSKIVQQFNQDLFIGGANFLYGNNSLRIDQSFLSTQNAYGKYYWELFYHIPMLVAKLLTSNQQFEDSKKWYEYIFNPTTSDNSDDRFWQLAYFRSLGAPEDIIEILTGNTQSDKDQITIYDLDPFDPEAIAYLRPGAFEKNTVMSYITNLLCWGDNLFTQYTWETITQAEMLYMLAKELLGKRPQIRGTFEEQTPIDLEQIEEKYPNEIPQFLIDVEDMQPGLSSYLQTTPALSANTGYFYFCIPENSELPSNYNLVNTRLYEIRHCLNILGQEQPLALFQPPINPMALVAASAEGISLADVPISLAGEIPYYRFSTMIEHAKSVTQQVIAFGQEILSVLEKKDAEALAALRATQEQSILDLTTSIKEQEVQELMNQDSVLDSSLQSANERLSYYNEMLELPISVLEALALALNLEAIAIDIPTTALHEAAAIAHLIPTVYGFADGDFQPGSSIEAEASAISTLGNMANNTANLTTTSASYARRSEEWELQKKLATDEVSSIGIQKTINQIRVENAQSQLNVHNQDITNNSNLQDFYTSKFTNQELYQWMVDQISSVYYQAYQMAYDLAKKAEVAYQFELNSNQSVISYGYWDSTQKGLLAGEKLIKDLIRLEKAYVDNHVRYLEIQKVISLKQLNPTALSDLTSDGKCLFSLTEQLFDYDFPGHYNRKIKSVSITIPAVVGPYQTIKASLEQKLNYLVLQPDMETVNHLITGEGSTPSEDKLRTNWRPNQQIAISKATNETGLFELNFNDTRYLPFEGTGAISNWELNIPQGTNQFDIKTISDIIIYINYTAQDGGDEFTQQVTNALKEYKGTLMVSMKQQFSEAWLELLSKESATFSFEDFGFPANLDGSSAEVDSDGNEISLLLQVSDPGYAPDNLKLNNQPWDSGTSKVKVGSNTKLSSDWTLTSGKVDSTKLMDIVFIIPYKANINW